MTGMLHCVPGMNVNKDPDPVSIPGLQIYFFSLQNGGEHCEKSGEPWRRVPS